MFKRATWLGVGFTLGAATTVVAARKARQQLDRYKPPALVDRVTTTITTKTTTLKDQVVVALNEGRSAAKDREAELRAEKGLTIVPEPDDSAPSSSSSLLFHIVVGESCQGRLSKEKRARGRHTPGVEDDELGTRR